MNKTEQLNAEYLDLYGDCLKDYKELPENCTFDDIKAEVDKVSSIGYVHHFKVGQRYVIAKRKYTLSGRTIKTSYLHIYVVLDFNECKVLQRYREQKNGNFKTY